MTPKDLLNLQIAPGSTLLDVLVSHDLEGGFGSDIDAYGLDEDRMEFFLAIAEKIISAVKE